MKAPIPFALSFLVALCPDVPRAADAARPSGDRAPEAAKLADPREVPPAPALIEDPKAVYRVPLDGAPIRGPAHAPVTIVEFLDLECPFSKEAAPIVKQIEDAYPGKVRIAFRHFPLSIHPNAAVAAMAAEAVRAQGGDDAFWKFTNAIFAAKELDAATIDRAGLGAGLDPKRVDHPERLIERLQRDVRLGEALGVSGTPTFFLNGRKLEGAPPLEIFKARVEAAIADAAELVKSGVAPGDVYERTIEKGATAPVRIAAPVTAPQTPVAHVPLRSEDPVKGPSAAPVTIVVFSDFECPFCAQVEPTLAQVEKTYREKVRIVWKHLPLPMHANALTAAAAAEAARAQGRFWQMHDKLFSNQRALSLATYERYAKELGLDLERFQHDEAAETTAKRIEEDRLLASSVGATGTPTLFVNCRQLVGAHPFETVKAVVDEEVAKAEELARKGEKLDANFYEKICSKSVAAGPAVEVAPPVRSGVSVSLRPDDPARGSVDARVTIVEFSDFQCPFCARAEPVLTEIAASHPKDVRIVWKHMPLGMHRNALPAALAAEAARAQGKFWEMHDRLFAKQSALSEASYTQYAKELGLDLARFDADRSSEGARKRVEEDVAAAGAARVDGTPTFIVNGELLVGSEGLREAVEERLARAKGAER